jgi:hypothetical protein
MCAQHNFEKGALALEDYRAKLRMNEFFATGDKLTLKHLLEHLKAKGEITRFADPVSIKESNGQVIVESANRKYDQMVYCPTTDWKYFYSILDVDVIDSDDDEDHSVGLQPRYLIAEKVFIGRVVGSRIRLFDGQHKIAALLWNGRRKFECKIYLDSNMRLLNQTNISAHDRFAQSRFFSSIMVAKLGAQFGKDFDNYKNLDDGHAKSEAGLMDYIKKQDAGNLTGAELNSRFRSYLYSSVLEHEDNKMRQLVSAGNRSTAEKPITLDMLGKSLFAHFLYREPQTHDLTTDAYRRQPEINTMVALMNFVYDYGLSGWDAKAPLNDGNRIRLSRIFGSKSMMAWADLLHGAICGKLELDDGEDRERPFYRDLSETDLKRIGDVVKRLYAWKWWSSPPNGEVDRILSANKGDLKNWFKEHGLTTGYLSGAAD